MQIAQEAYKNIVQIGDLQNANIFSANNLTFALFTDILIKDIKKQNNVANEGDIMNKNKVEIKIGGASYTIVSEDEPEYVEALAEELDEEIKSVCASNPSLSMTQAAVLVALDKADACKKATASSDNLRAQIKDYLEDSARARMEVDVARREVERLNREISNLRNRLAGK